MSSTAVLLFSRSARAEAEVKSFGVTRSVAVRIHEQLQKQIDQTLSVSSLPVIRSTEATQRGDTFGRRLANAVSDCWAQGFEQLIIVGGDTPELTSSDINRAHAALDAGRPTIGKNLRGGSFLIGLFKESFRQNQFAELPWQTKRIACALQTELGLHCENAETEVYELGRRADCNSQHDLCTFAKRAACEAWSLLVNNTACRIVDIDNGLILVSCFGESPTLRGPPALLHIAA